MASELNMYESQVSEYKMDVERLSRELQEVKKKYFLQKKKEHMQRYAQIIMQHELLTLFWSQREREGIGTRIITSHYAPVQGRPT